MSLPILTLLLMDLPKEQRKQVAEQLLPFAIPGGASQMTFAAITAERQVKKQAQLEERLVEEAITAGSIRTPEALANFPALQSAFNRLPVATRTRIIPPSAPAGAAGRASPFATPFTPGSSMATGNPGGVAASPPPLADAPPAPAGSP